MNRLFSSKTSNTVNQVNKMGFHKVTHVIFDMDGLLLDTERLYTVGNQKVLDKYGKTYTWEVKSTLMGLHRNEVAKKIVEIYDLPITWEQYITESHELLCALMKDADLLPDTEVIYGKIIADIGKSYGKIYKEETRLKLLGTTELVTSGIAVDDMNLPITDKEFQKKMNEMGRVRLPDVPLLRGAEKLIRHLRAENIPFALATSSGADMTEIKMSKHQELFSFFTHKVMGSSDPDVKAGKPSPDIFFVACERFTDSPKPENCLVFEDAPNGVKAARAAGMQVVMVPDENVPKEQLTEATVVCKSLEDVRLEEFGLPPFKS